MDEDRPTVDLGPRGAAASEAGDDDLGEETAAPASAAIPTRTLTPDPVHGLPTQPLGRVRSGSSTQHTRVTTTATPVEAMRHEEIARSRVFLWVAIVTCGAGLVAALSTTGDPVAFQVVIGGCVITSLGAVWMLRLVRDPAKYQPRKISMPALVIAFGAFGGVYYWGVGSPVAAMITYGIYFFSLGASAWITTAMYVLVAAIHALLGIAIITGAISDRGIISIEHVSLADQIMLLCVIEFLYLITFVTARVSQRVTLRAVESLEQAVRAVAHREALLAEARAELDRALKVGGPGRYTDQVVGSFRLGVLIGRGGMGEVYEAHSVTDRREAAVKLLHRDTLSEPTHVQRFIREAQTAARLDCPHVVSVLEVGTTTAEVPFLAMERLRGHDLAHQLRRQRRLTLEQAVELAEHVAAGLDAARKAEIVHRDLKPHNVFLAESDGVRRWKILDFGVSKSGGTGTLTKGHVVGTPAYMSPEQAKGEDVDHRADVYSLTAMLYRAVSGHPAFSGRDVPTTLYDVVYRIPTQPSILAPLPGDVDRVLAVGLAKDPRERFATSAELALWFTAAVRDALTTEQRQRADDLMSRQPWGTRAR